MRNIGRKSFVLFYIAILFPAYWIAYWTPAVGTNHDDGIYLVTAKALAEGDDYRIISLPTDPPQTKYPILFPAVLAVGWKMFPDFPANTLILKAIPFLSAILWLWFSYKLIREETGDSDAALVIVLLISTSSQVVYFSTTFMSETFFACIATWALIQLKRLERYDGVAVLPILFSSLLVAASFLTRTVGAPLVAAGTISLFLRRRYAAAAMFLFVCAVLVAPWFLWQVVNSGSSRITDPYYTFSNYRSWTIFGDFNLEQKYDVIAQNVLYLIISPLWLLNLKMNIVGVAVSILLFAFTCGGLINDVRKNIGSLNLYILFYIVIIIGWVWPPTRFLVPIMPLLLAYAYKEFGLCVDFFKLDKVKKYIYVLFVVIIGAQMLDGLLLCTKETLKRQAVSLNTIKFPQEDWRKTAELFKWIRQSTPQDTVLMIGMLDPACYLYTGRKAVRGIPANPYLVYYSHKPETVQEGMELANRIIVYQVKYVVRTPGTFFKEDSIYNDMLDRLVSEYPGALRLVNEGIDPSYRVYEVDQGKLRYALPSGMD